MPEPYSSVFKELLEKKVDIPATKTKIVDHLHELNEFLSENKFPIFENKGKTNIITHSFFSSSFLFPPPLLLSLPFSHLVL